MIRRVRVSGHKAASHPLGFCKNEIESEVYYVCSKTVRGELYYSALQRDRYRMGAIVRAELCQNTLHVSFDCLFGNAEFIRDDLISIAGGDLLQHLDLAVGQCVVRVMLRQFNGDLRWN